MEKIQGFLLKSQKELLYSLSFPLQRKEFLQPVRLFSLISKKDESDLFLYVVPEKWSPLWEKLKLEIFVGESDFSTSTLKLLDTNTQNSYTIERIENYPSLYHLVQLKPWKNEPDLQHLLFWIQDLQTLTQILHESIWLGRDQLRLYCLKHEGQDSYLLWAEFPSYFLIQKWQDFPAQIRLFYPLQEPYDIYLPWGYSHPLRAILLHTEKKSRELEPSPTLRTMMLYHQEKWFSFLFSDFIDIYQYLSFKLPEMKPEVLKNIEKIDPFQVKLRMVSRDYPAEPLLWRLSWESKDRLEYLLENLSEEDLNNILICLFQDSTGKRHFFIRELVVGKSRKFTDFGPYSYSTFRNIKNLYLPANKTLEPEIRLSRYSDLFQLKNGILTVLDTLSEQDYQIFTLEELSFKSLPVLIDYLVSEAKEPLQELLTQSVFDFQEIPLEFEGVVEAVKIREKNEKAVGTPAVPLFPQTSAEKMTKKETETKKAETGERSLQTKVTTPKNLELEKLLQAEDEAEDACIENPFFLEAWKQAGSVKIRFNVATKFREAILCIENALWLCSSTEEEQSLKTLLFSYLESQSILTAGWEKNIPKILDDIKHPVDKAAWLWQILKWLKDVRPGNATFLQVVELLKGENILLRKKTSWLLWRELILLNQDQSEEERQRERLLGQLNRQGLHEKDTFPFIRQKLARRFSHRRTGTGITNVLNLIDAGFKTSSSTKKRDFSSYENIGKAYLARGYIDIGKAEEGLALALEICKIKTPNDEDGLFTSYKARIIAASTLLRLGHFTAEPEVKKLIEQLALESRKTANEELSAASKIRITPYNLKKLFLEMLHLIHYAGPLQYPDFTRQIFQLTETIHFENKNYHTAEILHSSESFLGDLGINDEVCLFIRSLLQQSEILQDSYYFEMLFSALYRIMGEELFDENFYSLLLKVNYEELSIISIGHLDRAICFYGIELGEKLIKQIPTNAFPKAVFVHLMIQTSILERLSQEGKTSEGFSLFTQIFQETFSKKLELSDIEVREDCRQTLLKRLIDKLSGFGNVTLGVPRIKAIMENLSRFKDVGHQGEVLTRIAKGLSMLGSSDEAFKILNQVLQISQDIIERREAHYLICFKVIDICIQSLSELEEDTDRCIKIVEEAYAILQSARKKIRNLNKYYLCLAEFRCGFQFAHLGQEEKGVRIIEELLRKIDEFEANNIDSIEFMQEVARVAPLLMEPFSSKLLETIFQQLNTMAQGKEDPMFVEYSTDLIQICVDEVIQGEPLFKSELSKFQGMEERIIRQRLVRENIASR